MPPVGTRDTCVVDQHIEAAKLRVCTSAKTRSTAAASDTSASVAVIAFAFHAALGFEQRVDGLLARVTDMHARAGIDERACDHEPDARRTARYEHA